MTVAAQQPDLKSRLGERLREIYSTHGDGSHARVRRPNTVTEQFYPAMPTCDAYATEKTLWRAVCEENREQLNGIWPDYLATHTFVFEKGTRRLKQGDLSCWTGDVPLYYAEFEDKQIFTANEIQIKILILIFRHRPVNLYRV